MYSIVFIIHHNSDISIYILKFHSNAQQIHKISQDLNRFFSVWAPDLLRQSRLQRICLWTLWTVDRFGRQLRETGAQVVTFRWLYHLRNRHSFLESKPIHVKGISPQVYVCFITSTCEDLWGVLSRKFIALSFWQVHRPRIDPGSKVPPVQIRSFGDIITSGTAFWAHLASTTLRARTWNTSSTQGDSDVQTCEAIKMRDACIKIKGIFRYLGTLATYRKVTVLNMVKPAWRCWNSCKSDCECSTWTQKLIHSRDFQSRIDPMKNATLLLHLTKQQCQYHLRCWRRESRRKIGKKTAGCVEAWKL